MKPSKYQLNKPIKSPSSSSRPTSASNTGKSVIAADDHNIHAKKPKKKNFSSSNARNVAQFFDENVTVKVYGINKGNDSVPVSQGITKKFDVVISNGKLTVNHQMLTDECEKDFEKKWFFKEEGAKIFIDRTAKTEVFQVDKSLSSIPMILPRAEIDPKREKYDKLELLDDDEEEVHKGEAALQAIDPFYSAQLKSMSVGESTMSIGHASVASNQNGELMSVARLLDDFEASVYSAPYFKQNAKLDMISANRPTTAPSVLKSIGGGEFESHRMRQLILEKQRKSLETLYKSKTGSLRPNNPMKTVTPDYVLFIEALRRDILLYPTESIDLNRSMVNHENSLEEDLEAFNSATLQRSVASLPNGQSKINQQSTNSDGIGMKGKSHPLMMSLVDDDILLVQNSKILSLDLSNRSIGSDRGQCLAVALQYCPHLQILKLKNNRLADVTLGIIIQAAFGFSQLQYLDISENDVNKQTCAILCKYFDCINDTDGTQNQTETEIPTLSSGNLFENSSTSIHSATKCALEYVNMDNCNIGDELCGKIAKALISNDTIREFHISSNRIGTEESHASLAWSDLVQKNQTLVALNLSHNFFRRYSAQLLLKSLHYNRSLVYLNLSNNQISDQDAIVSASFLEKNTTLQSLDLSYNMIENKGCIALSYCLSQLSCVNFTHLNLLNNKIGDIGYKFALERMLFVVHQNYDLHYAMHHQQQNKMKGQNGQKTKENNNYSKTNNISSSFVNELTGLAQEHIQGKKDSKSVERPPPAKIYRLLNILCQPIKNNDRVASSTWSSAASSSIQFNPLDLSGTYEFQLSDAFDHVKARICMDSIEQNPCVTVKELKWYNDVVRGYEYPSVSRQIYSSFNMVKPVVDAIHHVCSDDKRALSNTTPRALYQESYADVILTDPFDKAHHLITLLYKLISLLNQPVEEKLKSSHLLEVRTVLVELGHRLSFNMTSELIFYLLEKWNRLDALHARYRIAEIYNPWRQQLSAQGEGTSKKSSNLGGSSKSNSVYQDIDEALKKEREENHEGEILISDPIVIIKFLICSIYDYILQHNSDMNIHQLYGNQQLFTRAQLLAVKHITLQRLSNISNQNTKSTLKVASAFEVYPPDHDKIQMNSYELLVRMITELTFQYNNSTGISAAAAALQGVDTDAPSGGVVPKKVLELPSNKHVSQTGKKSCTEEELLQDPIEECFLHATQFLQYVLLQIQNFTMISCPYQSVKIVSNSISDVRNDLPSHGTLSLEIYVPSVQSTFHKSFSLHKQYLFDAFLTTLSYDYAMYDHVHILYETKNDTKNLFSNVVNLTNTLLHILEYDDNILHLTCEQAELILKIIFAAKKGYHMYGIERLLLQINNVHEVRRFITRNCYFHEIIWLRKKLNYLFKVLVGNLNGHYMLDLSDPIARLAAQKLATIHNEQLYLVQHHIQSNKPNHSQLPFKKSNFSTVDMEAIPPTSVISLDIEQLYFRNASYNGSYMPVTAQWLEQLPSVGKLRFDYVSFLEPFDFMVHLLPATTLSHTNINGLSLLETTLFQERYHQLHGNTFGSCFTFFGCQDARVPSGSISAKNPLDNPFNRVYSNTYQLVLRNQKYHYHTNDDRLFQAELLKKEGYADMLVQQMFAKDVYKLSQKIYKKLKIPPKNSVVYDLNNPECRDYVRRLRSIERANGAAKPVTKQNDVLNIMMKRYHRPALGGYHTHTSDSNTNLSTTNSIATPQKETVPASSEGSIVQEEDEDEDEDGSDVDDDNSATKELSAAEKKKATLAALAAEPTNNNFISRESYFRLQDQSSNLDTGARQAFFMRATPKDKENPSTPQTSKALGFEAPVNVKGDMEKTFEMQSLSLWKDYLETTWSCYNVSYLEYTIKKAQGIFASIQKENSQNYQYHYTIGAEKDGVPDEVFQSEMFLQLAKSSLQYGITFNINGGKRRKTQFTAAIPGNGESLRTPFKRNSTMISLSSPSSPSKLSFAATTDLVTPIALQCFPFELSLLILETCCLFNICLEAVQIKSILESLKSQKAPHEVMVRTISIIWRSVIDKENLPQCVRKACGESVYLDCIHRFGFLNFWSPLHPEGKYDLDMTDRQHRDVLSIVASLLVEDETIEVVDCQYQPTRLHPFESVDILQFALVPPHSIGIRSQQTIGKSSRPSTSRSKPTSVKGQGSRNNSAATNSKDPPAVFSGDFTTGKLLLKVKSKVYVPPSSGGEMNNNGASLPSAPIKQNALNQSESGSTRATSQAASGLSFPIEVLARQQAVRRVYCLYKQSLIEQYILAPLAEEEQIVKNALKAHFAHMLYPLS